MLDSPSQVGVIVCPGCGRFHRFKVPAPAPLRYFVCPYCGIGSVIHFPKPKKEESHARPIGTD